MGRTDEAIVLNQYRSGSSYKDEVGLRYHFPSRYRRSFSELPIAFVYYEPREGGEQQYFGAGYVSSCYEDTEEAGHFYADICGYHPFPRPVSFYSASAGTWEPAKTMRNSVRRITAELFTGIVVAGGIVAVQAPARIETFSDRLHTEYQRLNEHGKPPTSPQKVRRVQRLLELYERPSAITNYVKRTRGDTCQLCGVRGFRMRNGRRYCEVHHLFHLSENPPPECMGPEYLVILCANCHRKMHFADVHGLERCDGGWRVRIDGEHREFATAAEAPVGAMADCDRD